MFWPTEQRPVPLEQLGWINTSYLGSSSPYSDPYLIWGTYVDMEEIDPFLSGIRKKTGTIVSTAHVLVASVAASLKKHPEINRRVIGRRVYDYRNVNIVMPMLRTSTGEVDSIFLRAVDELSLKEVAERFWNEARQRAVHQSRLKNDSTNSSWVRWTRLKRWLHLQWVHRMSSVGFFLANRFRLPVTWDWEKELHAAGAFVNYLGSPGAPPLTSHKLASLAMNSYSIAVTLGGIEPRPAVVDGEVVVRKQASLFVRVDHRFVNGHQAGEFVQTLRTYLADPAKLIAQSSIESSVQTQQRAA